MELIDTPNPNAKKIETDLSSTDIEKDLKKVELNKSDRYISWLPITKSRIKKYPYMGVATMALGAIIFLISGGANSIN